MKALLCAAILTIGAVAAGAADPEKASDTVDGLNAGRVKAVAAMLAEQPAGFGRPITDRAAWDTLAKVRTLWSVVAEAEKLLDEPVPESPDDLYLDFSRTGNRRRWERVAGQRRGRVTTLALAECLEAKGRFLGAFEAAVAALCTERTWLMPAHDRSLANFRGDIITIDLGSSHLGVNLAAACDLLGDRLSEPTRRLIRDNVRRRILDPFLRMVAGKQKRDGWFATTNNWNAVCLANVVGTALAMVESPEERARFVVAAEVYSENFLKGFTPDGYCSEGLGYWHYGFGHYLLLAEAIHQATGGKVDLFERQGAREPARFGYRIEITGGVCPAFADCNVTARPDARMLQFIGRRYRLGADPSADKQLVGPAGNLFPTLMYSFPNSATQAPPAEQPLPGPGLRTWFEDAGVLVCRPAPGSASRLGVAMKGGHNAEHHNHNDVGSYVVVVGDKPVLCDPGAEVYTARTFSGRRYESNVLNSFGHPVPRVAGELQKTGRNALGKVVRTGFTDAADEFALDLAPAYAVKELKKLQRTFSYARGGAGSLTVTDEVAFASPQAFETVLVTLGTWEKTGPATLVVTDGDQAVRVTVKAVGGKVEFADETIREDVRTRAKPTRIAVRFAEPVTKATIELAITPLAKGN